MGTDPSIVPSNETRGSGHKVDYRKLQLNMRKNVFTLWVTEHCNNMPREVVVSCPGEIQKPSGHNPVQPGISQSYLTVSCQLLHAHSHIYQ